MKAKLLGLAIALTLLSPAFAAIDFTPTAGEWVMEGIKSPLLYFHDNDQKVSYVQPGGWTYTGDSTRIKFMPPNVPQAFGEMGQAPLPAPQNIDDPTTKLLQDKVIHSLSGESHDAVVVVAEKNPLMINGHETFEVIVEYQLYGERYRQSVLFLNLSDTQLTFRFVSRKPDFEKLHQAFRGSLCSLQWL